MYSSNTKNNPVAIYWDLENIHASVYDLKHGKGAYNKQHWKRQKECVHISQIYGFAETLGSVVINRAYANWQGFASYNQELLKTSAEGIQVFPPSSSAKNGADIKMCLDTLEDIQRHPHISTVLVVSGDSDFISLAQKVRTTGRQIVGVGVKRCTSMHWANSCTSFRFYEDLVEKMNITNTTPYLQKAV